MSDYKNKYLKYKNKYLELKNRTMRGGLIDEISPDKLDSLKSDDEIPDAIKKYIKMMTIPDSKIIRVGSSMNKIQPYYSDVDVMDIVYKPIKTEELIKYFIENLKILVINITNSSKDFFSDFKAGGLHWTVEQILNEKNGELSLYNACQIKDVVKLDIIVPYDERYLEMSTFFILKSVSEYINVTNDYFSNFKNSLLVDIEHYKDTKPFKSIKRVWSLARLNKDNNTLKMLYKLIKSNIALIAQVNADIETIILLIEHKSNYDLKFIFNELDGFKERLSSILDVTIDIDKVDLMIENIKLMFGLRKTVGGNETDIIQSLTKLHDYLLNIINNETFEYLKSINYKFPQANNIQTKINNVEAVEIIS
jgi:hypothetical protein